MLLEKNKYNYGFINNDHVSSILLDIDIVSYTGIFGYSGADKKLIDDIIFEATIMNLSPQMTDMVYSDLMEIISENELDFDKGLLNFIFKNIKQYNDILFKQLGGIKIVSFDVFEGAYMLYYEIISI